MHDRRRRIHVQPQPTHPRFGLVVHLPVSGAHHLSRCPRGSLLRHMLWSMRLSSRYPDRDWTNRRSRITSRRQRQSHRTRNRDLTVELGVVGEEDFTHAAFAKALEDAIPRGIIAHRTGPICGLGRDYRGCLGSANRNHLL